MTGRKIDQVTVFMNTPKKKYAVGYLRYEGVETFSDFFGISGLTNESFSFGKIVTGI